MFGSQPESVKYAAPVAVAVAICRIKRDDNTRALAVAICRMTTPAAVAVAICRIKDATPNNTLWLKKDDEKLR
jgi:hypothetical protein